MASTSTPDNTLIYEVVVSVPKDKSAAYAQWLHKFVEDMLKIDGFLAAEVFTSYNASKDASTTEFAIQYRIENNEKLEKYLKNEQPAIATKGVDDFHYTVVSRRTLSSQFKSIRQTTQFGYVF